MWVSAILGMATKYSEIALAVKYRDRNKKGGGWAVRCTILKMV